MKLLKLTLSLLLSLFVTTGEAARSMPSRGDLERVLTAVQPLRSSADDEQGIFCTVFSINQQAGLWMTARHCTEAEGGFAATIAGAEATIVHQDAGVDVAVLHADTDIATLPLSPREGRVGEPIFIVGFPHGLEHGKVATFGFVGGLSVIVPGRNFASNYMDVATAGGNSGSPVLDVHGRLLGVLWGGWSGSDSLTVPFEPVAAIYRHFAEMR